MAEITDVPGYRKGQPHRGEVLYIPFFDGKDPAGSTDRAEQTFKTGPITTTVKERFNIDPDKYLDHGSVVIAAITTSHVRRDGSCCRRDAPSWLDARAGWREIRVSAVECERDAP